jgi:hypothetical protein
MQAILLLVLSNMYGGPRHYSSGPVPSLWTPPTPEETMKLNGVLDFYFFILYVYVTINSYSRHVKTAVELLVARF